MTETIIETTTLPPAAKQLHSVFIGNLAWTINDEELFALCTHYDCISASVTMGNRDGRSRGFGLATFDTLELADACISALNSYEYEGRELLVKHDEGPKMKKDRRYGVSQNTEKNPNYTGAALFIGNLPWETQDDELFEILSIYNPLSSAIKRGNDGRSRGWATALFDSPESCDLAIEGLTGISVGDRTISVRKDFHA